jgi:signal transduction histidine kinase
MSAIILAIVTATLVILLLIVGIAFSFSLIKRQKERQIMELTETKLNFEKEIRLVETEVTEQVLSHVASELHDNIGQMLTAMHIQIENQTLDFPETEKAYTPLKKYLTNVTQQVRSLSKSLNNDFIFQAGLVKSIQAEVNRLNELRRFDVQLETDTEEVSLQKDQELMVFRIFQEISQNALKHSRAKNLWVNIKEKPNTFELEIKDDGVGFDVIEIEKTSDGSGLKNIIKRADLAGLTCDLKSEIGRGTSYVFKGKPDLSIKK